MKKINVRQFILKAFDSEDWTISECPRGNLFSTFSTRHVETVKIVVMHDDNSIILFVPAICICPDDHRRGKLAEVLLDLNWCSHLARFEMDRDDGEVRARVALNVHGPLNKAVIVRAVQELLRLVDESHLEICAALGGLSVISDLGYQAALAEDTEEVAPSAAMSLDDELAALLGQRIPTKGATPSSVTEVAKATKRAAILDFNVDEPLERLIQDLCSFHPLTVFEENEFLLLLRGSLSLSVPEKRRVIDSIPMLSQYQIDELKKTFSEERNEFVNLMAREADIILRLQKEKKREWAELVSSYLIEIRARLSEAAASNPDSVDFFNHVLSECTGVEPVCA
jgi:hypothetical protein